MKIKSHSGAKKRVRRSGKKHFKMRKSCRSHLLANKSKRQKRLANRDRLVSQTNLRKLKSLLPNP